MEELKGIFSRAFEAVKSALTPNTPLDDAIDSIRDAVVTGDDGQNEIGKRKFESSVKEFGREVRSHMSWQTFAGALLLLSTGFIAPKRLLLGGAAATFMMQFSTSYTQGIRNWGNGVQEREGNTILGCSSLLGGCLLMWHIRSVGVVGRAPFELLATGIALPTGYIAAHRVANKQLI